MSRASRRLPFELQSVRTSRRPCIGPGARARRSIETSDVLAARALERASADLRLLLNSGPAEGERYVAAGVPWFSCLFGRDSLITSLQLLCVRPQIARSTLSILGAATRRPRSTIGAMPSRARSCTSCARASWHGPTRYPHTPYYGTVDATPLWLMLLDEYERWTGDAELVDRLWPNALAALRWIDEYGDVDGDGLIEYQRHSSRGLLNQGWKDSGDAITQPRWVSSPTDRSRSSRSRATPTRHDAASLGLRGCAATRPSPLPRTRPLNASGPASRTRSGWRTWAPTRSRWMARSGRSTALPPTPDTRCGRASASPDRAASVARVLTGAGMWSGWGIRTLSSDMTGYNPIGYHLGTIWPHDNGICAAGFARYGLFDESKLVAGALLDATVHFREARLPELFCGFERERSPLPVPYPVACSPQAWAAGSLFHLLVRDSGHAAQRARTAPGASPSNSAGLTAGSADAQPARRRCPRRPGIRAARAARSRSRSCVGRGIWTSLSDSDLLTATCATANRWHAAARRNGTTPRQRLRDRAARCRAAAGSCAACRPATSLIAAPEAPVGSDHAAAVRAARRSTRNRRAGRLHPRHQGVLRGRHNGRSACADSAAGDRAAGRDRH